MNRRFNSEEIAKLPTILDLMDEICAMENYQIPTLGAWNQYFEEGFYSAIRKGKSEEMKAMLMPTSQGNMIFYRGQAKEYCPSLPSIYRPSYKDPNKAVIARLKSMEFQLLIKCHPVVQEMQRRGFVIDYDAICQHYGFPTQMMDLTNNKWVAAFMATTTFDTNTGVYTPIGQDYEDGYGVIYISNEKATRFLHEEKLFTVGYQFFKRPSLQFSFGLKMEKGEDFTKFPEFEAKFFRHDLRLAEYVYAMAYNQERFSPHDHIADLALAIQKSNKVLRNVILLAYSFFYSDKTTGYLEGICKENGIDIVEEPAVWYDTSKLQNECEYWNTEGFLRLEKSILPVIPVCCIPLE